MKNTTIVIPTLNEVENLKLLIPELRRQGANVILICDNGSTDGTVELARDLHCQVSCRQSGTVIDAVVRGINEATTPNVIVMDADLSHDTKVIPTMKTLLDTKDMVVGSRYCTGGYSGDSIFNKLISWGGNLLAYGLAPGIKDRMAGMFGIRKSKTVGIQIHQGMKPMLEYYVRGDIQSVAEIPIDFTPRMYGKTKLGRNSIVTKSLWEVFKLYTYKYRQFLKFVSVGGVGACWYMGFTYMASAIGWPLYAGMLIGAVFATMWNYTMNKFWTFGIEEGLNGVWNFGHKNDDGDFDWWEWYGPHPVKRFWKRRMGNYVKELAGSPSSLISLGCGSSPIINLFSGSKVGLDNNPSKLEFIKQYSDAEFRLANLCDMATDGKYEVVICNEVLEHLPTVEVDGVIKHIAELTTDRAVISIPDYGSRLGRILERLFHGKFHSTITVERLNDICLFHGLKAIEEKRFLWDTAVLYRRV